MSKGALEPYKIKNRTSKELEKVVKGSVNNNTKPTPLQWACFKSHI